MHVLRVYVLRVVSRELLIGRKGPVTRFITFALEHATPRTRAVRQIERRKRPYICIHRYGVLHTHIMYSVNDVFKGTYRRGRRD